MGINLGAPGDRRDENGTLWLDYPSIGGLSPDIEVKVEGKNLRWFRQHASKAKGDGLGWVASSGVEGIEKLSIDLGTVDPATTIYAVRMVFLEPNEHDAGQRIFKVTTSRGDLIADLDISREASGSWRQVVKQFDGVASEGRLTFSFEASSGSPVLSGVEIIRKPIQ